MSNSKTTRNRNPIWFVICDKCGRRLCRDKRYRNHVPFGSMSNCLKTYKLQGAAQTAAYHNACPCKPGNSDTTHLIALYPGDEMDAAGNITRAEEKRDVRIFKIIVDGCSTHLPPHYFEDENEFRNYAKRFLKLKFTVNGFELINNRWRQIDVTD